MSGSKPKGKATPGGVAVRAKKQPKPKDATPLPISKSRQAFFQWLSEKPLEEQQRVMAELEASPDGVASRRLEQLLKDAHFDPAIGQSAGLFDFVFLMRDLLVDYIPGMTLAQLLEPLRTYLSRYEGSGRTPKAETYRRWHEQNEKLKATRPTLTAEDRYEDIAAASSQPGKKPVKWRAVQAGIGAWKRGSR